MTIKRVLMFFVAFVAALLSSFSVNGIFLPDSDVANSYFAALDMARGNTFLHGWHLSPDNFWLIDLLGMSALVKVFGGSSDIPFTLSAFWLAAIAGFASLLSDGKAVKWHWQRALPVVLFIGLVPIFLRTPVSYFVYAPYHMGTIAISMLGLLVAQSIFSGRYYFFSGAILFFISVIIFVSDFFGFAIFLLPLLIVGFLCFLKDDKERKAFYFIAVPIIFSWVGAQVIKYFVTAHAGFSPAKLSPSFASIERIPGKVVYTIKSLLDFYGVDFFGPPEQLLITLVRIVPFLAMLLFFKSKFSSLNRIKTFFFESDRVSQVMIIGAGIDFFAAFFSDFAIEKSDIIRYFSPFFVYSIILYARNVPKIYTPAFLLPCVFSVFICLGLWKVWAHQTVRFVDIFHIGHQVDTREVSFVLSQHHLRQGYAGYWDASATTFNTDGRLRVRALKNAKLFTDYISDKPENECTLVPYLWLSKESWYYRSEVTEEKEIFFVTHEDEDPNRLWIRHGDLVASLGEPDQHYVLRNGVAIDVYTTERLDGCRGIFLNN
ncbi:MAG: hypothetical protein ABF785_12450 [Acetobacter papayae]|uniref:hypothetical protein n=1 Tax=Acetobacter papayae TaxID=1076592 RepID=UPI0039EA8B4D